MRGTNRMKAVITGGLLCLMSVPGLVSAQEDVPNIQGRWILNKLRCLPVQNTGKMRGGMTGVPLRMDITVEGNKVTMS